MLRKPTFGGVFTNFDSFILISYKHGLVNKLLFPCFQVYSSYEKLQNEIVYFNKIFKNNRNPNDFVDVCIKIFSDKLYVTKKKLPNGSEKSIIDNSPIFGSFNF